LEGDAIMKTMRLYLLLAAIGACVSLAVGVRVYELGRKLDRLAVAVEALDILGRRRTP